MQSKIIFFLVGLSAVASCLVSCSNVEEVIPGKTISFEATLVYENDLKGFASGSGMEFYRRNLYLCGDDDAYLWSITSENQLDRLIQLWDTTDRKKGRLNSKTKPDFEAMTIFPSQIDTSLLIFSSGSKSPQRDIVLQVFPNSLDSVYTHNGAYFFKWLRNNARLTVKSTNLEGAAMWGDKLILLNRATNEVYLLPQKGVNQFLTKGDTTSLTLENFSFHLPTIKNDTARFSGASVLDGTNILLFSASVESTEDWTDDGGVLGSFIGMIDLTTLDQETPVFSIAPILNKDKTIYLGKVEGLHGFKSTPNSIEVKAITDNDDGTTQFLIIQLNIP